MTSRTGQASLPTDGPGEGERPRLLVIDDDTVHRMVICKIAANTGYEVFGVASYEDAARRIREHQYDCITLDLSLGKHAGVEVLRDLRESKCKAPIIIISGAAEAISAETVKIGKSFALNIRNPIPKPVNLAALRQSLIDIKAQTEVRRRSKLPSQEPA